MNDTTLFSTIWGADAVAVVGTAVQMDEVKQWISMAITIVAGIVSIALSIWKWWKSAKKDGKIDEKEIEDLQQILDHKKEKEENKDE